MKCSSCGKEFGAGTHCQHCGVDRVTGLANYSSYDTSDYHGANTSHYNSSYNSSPKTMVCYACSEIIPLGSTFCPVCGKKLLVTCPNCGHEYSSQYSICNRCGTNREQYLKEQKINQKRHHKEQERQKAQRNKERNFYNLLIIGLAAIIIGFFLITIAAKNGVLWLGVLITSPILVGGLCFIIGAFRGDPYEKEMNKNN